MTEPRPTLGVVLAGGQSRRMGQDKAQLMLDGRSLLQRAVDLLQSIGVTDIVVSGERHGYRWVADSTPGGGPLAGLCSVMQRHQGERLLVLPVDMPLLDAEMLGWLLSAEPQASAVHFVDAVLPLRVDTKPSIIDAAVEQLAAVEPSQRSLRSLMQRLNARQVPLPPDMDCRRLQSCNTPGQWQAMQA